MFRAEAVGGRVARLLVLAAIGLSALLLVAACGDDEDESSGGASATATISGAASPAAGSQVKVGGAGIATKPRDIGGLFTIDDGIAMFKDRPASEDRTGITKDTIKIGRHFALTGPGAVGGPTTAAIEAAIEKVNAAGGVHGRKIELTTRDDQFNPAVASQVVRELVERDKVFAMFDGLGTAQSAAVFDYLIAKKVPNLFMQTGAVEFGEPTHALAYPGASAYILETRAMADFIYAEHPDAKLAIIYQNDGYGKNNLDGLRAGAKAHGKELVVAVSYDIGTPDLTSQIQQVVKSGATAVFLATYPNEGVKVIKGLRETAGSKMPIYLSVVSTSGTVAEGAGQQNYDGAVGSISSLDVVDLDKPVVQAAKKLADETKQPFVLSFLSGVRYVEHLVRALELAGPDPTREGLILALDNGFDGSWTCSLCLAPPILGPQDHWPWEAYQPVRWNAAEKKFVRAGDLLIVETSKGKGIRGNIEGYDCTEKSPCPWK